jgi:aspartate racemase
MTPLIDLGILGGMGPRATNYFMDQLLTATELRHHPERDQDYPNLVVRYACQLPDRTAMLTSDRAALVNAISKEAQNLVDLGCPKLIMPCITAHALLDSELSRFPFIDVRKTVAHHIARFCSEARVGVLATRGARISRSIDRFLASTQQLMPLEPDEEQSLMNFIYGAAKTWNGGKDVSAVETVANKLRSRGCTVIIAACTELEMCLAQTGTVQEDILLPLKIAAESWVSNWTKRS